MSESYRQMADEDLLALLAGERGSGPSLRVDRRAVVGEALRRMAGRGERRPPALRCSADAVRLLGPRLSVRRQERFYVVALDARNRPAGRHLVAVGTLSSCVVHPREVFAPLVRGRAAAALLVHNHPSGDATPSPEDEALTARLEACGRLLGIPVLDHLIVGAGDYFSFRDAGKLGREPPVSG